MDESKLQENLIYLKLPFIRENYEEMAKKAAQKEWTHVQYFGRLMQGEA